MAGFLEWNRVSAPKVQKIRISPVLEFDTIYGFFDEAEQAGNCGTDMILHINDNHSFKLRMGVGNGTNTFAEILAS